MIDPELCQRIEETNPTDRVRGTIVNVLPGGMFVVKYDDGNYIAYQPEDREGFHAIPDKPVPLHAASLIHRLREKHGKIPPEDAQLLRGKIPSPASEDTLTPVDAPPNVEA
jgi:hypothetical protein